MGALVNERHQESAKEEKAEWSEGKSKMDCVQGIVLVFEFRWRRETVGNVVYGVPHGSTSPCGSSLRRILRLATV